MGHSSLYLNAKSPRFSCTGLPCNDSLTTLAESCIRVARPASETFLRLTVGSVQQHRWKILRLDKSVIDYFSRSSLHTE